MRAHSFSWLAIAGLLFSTSALAQGLDDLAGRVVGEAGGVEIELPLLRAAYDVDIAGDIANVTLTQEFANPASLPMNATYLFPLNQGAAIHAMEMLVGDELVKAVIQERQKAEATFEQAKEEGRAASLLTQHRPNMFTQSVANLMPGLPITVTLSYVQSVSEIDGAYELVVPLVVGPRYQAPAQAAIPGLAGLEPNDLTRVDDLGLHEINTRTPSDDHFPQPPAGKQVVQGWHIERVPEQPPVAGLDIPDLIDSDRVAIDIAIAGGGVPVHAVTSSTHALSIDDDGNRTRATLASGRTIDNRDFVLRYELGAEEVDAGLLAHFDERGGFFSLMITPPEVANEALATPRELVFVLDTSGSMGGEPIQASKRFMDAALKSLRPNDYFRIISFANAPSQFAQQSLIANPGNLRAGRAHVANLSAGGGTEIDRAIRAAFDTGQPADTMRIVVFLSDGYIGDEASVLRTIRNRIGDARIYAFGVGTGVNRYLLDGMASEGRGYARYVDPTETSGEAAMALAQDLKTPLLTDIEIDWGGLGAIEVGPGRIPDLFAGNTLRVFGRYSRGGTHEISIRGKIQGRPAELPLTVQLPAQPQDDMAETSAIPVIWARRQIADLERAYAVRDGRPEAIEAAITDLGLNYNLQTRYTSFVAVSERVVNKGHDPVLDRQVPQQMVEGVGKGAYPEHQAASGMQQAMAAAPMMQGVTPQAYPQGSPTTGGSAPEPEVWALLLLVGLMGLFWYRRQQRLTV